MIKVLPISYGSLISDIYHHLFFLNNDTGFSLLKEKNKYRLAKRFPEKKFKRLAGDLLELLLKTLQTKYYDCKLIIVDGCLLSDCYLTEIFLNKVSPAKRKMVGINPPVKFFLNERDIRLPEDKLAVIFDQLFDSWFKKSKLENVYFVRAKGLPSYEAINQLKDVFHEALLPEWVSENPNCVTDINKFIFSKLKDFKFPKNKEYQEHVERLIFPYV